MDRSKSDSASVLDRAAIMLSGLCLLHCLALPFVLVALPAIAQFGTEHFHMQMLLVVVPVSLYALASGYRRHRRIAVPLAGVLGIALLFLGGVWAHYEGSLLFDRVCTVSGSLILAVTHYHNSRLARRHRST